MRRAVSACLAALCLGQCCLPVYAEDMNKGMKLGLDIITASAEEKDAAAGVKKAGLKTFSDEWTWNYVVGGYEKIITQNADAEIPDFKQKVDKVTELIERIGNISTQLGEGKYDDAAITAIDQTVAIVDHPAVNAIWAMVKLTYESHKAVVDTKAELDIEALYGKVNNDRLLMGASSGDSPKQIQINSQTVDRFFYNYLIKDTGTRELMKAYVQKRLGQEWPELGVTDWVKSFTLVGTGLDEQKDYEVEQLTEFKNVSKQWITALLKDINNQAKVDWAATRVRQQRVEFDRFAANFKGFSDNLPAIIEEFKNRKAILAEMPKCKSFAGESSAAYSKLKSEFSSLKPTQLPRMNEIYTEANNYKNTAHVYSIKALMVDNVSLSNQLDSEYANWNKFVIEILNKLDQNKNNADEATISAFAAAYPDSGQMVSAANSLKSIVPTYNFKVSIEKAYQELSDLLNSGKMTEAYQYIGNWTATEQAEATNTYVQSLKNLSKAAGCNAADVNQYGGSRSITIPSGNSGRWSMSRGPGFIMVECGNQQMGEGPVGLADEANWAAFNAFITVIVAETGKLNDLYNAFNGLKQRRQEEYNGIASALNRFYGEFKIVIDSSTGKPYEGSVQQFNEKPRIVQDAEDALKYLNENTYVAIGQIDSSSPHLASFSGVIGNKIFEISSVSSQLELSASSAEQYYPAFADEMEKAVKDWAKFEKPDAETVKEIQVLVDPNFDYDAFAKVLDMAAANWSSHIEFIRSFPQTFRSRIATETENRAKDVEYLNKLAYEWDIWMKMEMDNGVFERNYIPTGVPLKQEAIKRFDNDLRIKGTYDYNLNQLILDKPCKHYATADELAKLPELQKAKADLQKFAVYTFITSSCPSYAAKLEALFSGKTVNAAKEDNIFINGMKQNVVYKSDLEKISNMIAGISPESDDFAVKMKEIAALLPGTMLITTPADFKADWEKKNKRAYTGQNFGSVKMVEVGVDGYKSTPIGEQFAKIYAKLSGLAQKRCDYIINKAQKDAEEDSRVEVIRYYAEELKKISDEVQASSISETMVNSLYTTWASLHGRYIDRGYGGLDSQFKEVENSILALKNKGDELEKQRVQQVNTLYANFKQAYESKSDSQIMNFLSSNWSAGDSTTLADLETNFRNMFSVYDSIQYGISNIQVVKRDENRYSVNYEVTIVGQIYDMSITRNEKSTVTEEVVFENGKPKISRTLSGQFWYRE